MNRLKILFLGAGIAGSVLSGCRKHDWVTVPNGRDKCEIVSASSVRLSNESDTELDLFKKTFAPGTYKLTSLFAFYRNSAGGPAYPEIAESFPVSYEGQKMIVRKNASETVSFFFDNSGDVVKAINAQFGASYEYKFVRSGGKLSKIMQRYSFDGFTDEWTDFYKVNYDASKKNVVRETLGTDEVITYTHNNSKKVKGQFLADQTYGDSFYFLALVKYLNLCPELRSENLITKMTVVSASYPGDYQTVYSGHVIDGGGKVTSYHARATYAGDTDPFDDYDWNLSWSCLK
ncbi:MAG: hypothetical protein EOO09_04090 [Chitinophagaceae bacterium]|nr:MAG: hypothetical protein EOO09_04090 [Chitinophagaceae bacterium]